MLVCMSNWEQRYWAKVNKTEGCWLWTAATCEGGYGRFLLDGRTPRAHRLSYSLAHGAIPDGMQVDHTCFVRRCVNPEHLRLATPKQNNENTQGAYRNSKSGIRGVRWHKPTGKWEARVQHNGKPQYLGVFSTPEEAEAVVMEARLRLFTHNDVDRNNNKA